MSTCINCGADHDFTPPAVSSEYARLCHSCALSAACTDAAKSRLDDHDVEPQATRCLDAVRNLIEAWRAAGVAVSEDREESEIEDAQSMITSAR
jgi:hypothetical protein